MLLACYDMYGVAECGDVNGTRPRYIQRIGDGQCEVNRGEPGFKDRLTKNLTAFRTLRDTATVGIVAIHWNPTTYWQRHGIATCSAALGSGFAVGAAHFDELPGQPDSSTLAAACVPQEHLEAGAGKKRTANSWMPKEYFGVRSQQGSALVRLFHS
jgi:hypothetical protein